MIMEGEIGIENAFFWILSIVFSIVTGTITDFIIINHYESFVGIFPVLQVIPIIVGMFSFAGLLLFLSNFVDRFGNIFNLYGE